jgi:hypothetical protein
MIAKGHFRLILTAATLTMSSPACAGNNPDVIAKLMPTALLGCWEYDRFGVTPYSGEKEVRIGSHLMCFNGKGGMTGVTFDAGDGWDWSQAYAIEGNQVVTGEDGFRIIEIGDKQMMIEESGKSRTYRLVCRTTREDVQCERCCNHGAGQQPCSCASK